MTLYGVITLILRNSIASQADYVTLVDDRPIMSARYRLPVTLLQIRPTLQHGISAIAEPLVFLRIVCLSTRRPTLRQIDNSAHVPFSFHQLLQSYDSRHVLRDTLQYMPSGTLLGVPLYVWHCGHCASARSS